VTVLGVSGDQVVDQAAFRGKFQLPYQLLADPDLSVAQAYGARRDRSAARVTYVIDEKGKVQLVYPKVDPSTHATAILEAMGV
jgi:thioredoxin-dependent peroxiredoxin